MKLKFLLLTFIIPISVFCQTLLIEGVAHTDHMYIKRTDTSSLQTVSISINGSKAFPVKFSESGYISLPLSIFKIKEKDTVSIRIKFSGKYSPILINVREFSPHYLPEKPESTEPLVCFRLQFTGKTFYQIYDQFGIFVREDTALVVNTEGLKTGGLYYLVYNTGTITEFFAPK